jgi:hypothetical protein
MGAILGYARVSTDDQDIVGPIVDVKDEAAAQPAS